MPVPLSGAKIVGYQSGGVPNTQETMRSVIGAQAGLIGGVPDPAMLRATKGTGMFVQVAAGNALVRDPATRQAYAVSFDAAQLALPTTGVSARSDVITLRVADQFAGDGVYATGETPLALRVHSDVPNTTTTLDTLVGLDHPELIIARVDLPAQCTSIAAATLVPLTPTLMTQARSESRVIVATANEEFPLTTGNVAAALQPTFYPPIWARRAVLTTHMSGIDLTGSGTAEVRFAAQLGSSVGTTMTLQVPVSGGPVSVAGTREISIAAANAGQPVPARVAVSYSNAQSGIPWVRAGRTVITHQVTFEG